MSTLIIITLAVALAGSPPCNDEDTINLFTAWQDACPVNQQPVEPAE